MSTGQVYDVIVIGGGPSGMMAAGTAALRGKKVLLIEKNKELGKKLSITGGGRCNILNAEEDSRVLLENYGEAAKYLHSPFSEHGMRDSWDFFESRGLPIVVEARRRAFPKTQDARDVTRVMRDYVQNAGVELKLDTKVKGFEVEDGLILGIKTINETFRAKQYILATGGSSHRSTGSTGEGITWLGDVGHTIHSPSPDIVPLTVKDQWVKDISGTTLSFMKITFASDRKKESGKFSKTGKILFTHFGLSGPLILNSAHQVKELLRHDHVKATIDMYPDTEEGTLRNRLVELFHINKNKTFKNILKECTPAGMAGAVAAQFPIDVQEEKVHSITKEARNELARVMKAMPLTITGTMGLEWAVTSDGGVDLSEVDTKTMQSKLHENLYFTGDVLHINRPSGGYSLQLCWTTGYVAGKSC